MKNLFNLHNIVTKNNRLNANINKNNWWEKRKLQDLKKNIKDQTIIFWINDLKEQIYFLYFDLKKIPTCPTCQKKLKFLLFSKWYKSHCSSRCATLDKEVKSKRQKTCNEIYWIDHHFKNNDIKEKIKRKNIEKYWNENPAKSQLIKDKQSLNWRNKKEEDKILISKKISLKSKKNTYERWNEKIKNLVKNVIPFEDFSKDSKTTKYNWICKNCNTSFEDYFNYNWLPKCPKCFPPIISKPERDLKNFISNILNTTILSNDRTIISPKELDLFLPEKLFAIEYNGLIFHSYWKNSNNYSNNMYNKILDNWKIENKTYHLDKTLQCQKLWIQLFHINENEWLNPIKQKIWKSMIKNKLWKTENKIFARKCIIKEVSSLEKNNFLENNHLQWADKSSIKLWLYYENELVQIMTFWKSRYNKKIDWEMHRFSTKIWYNIIGGASKIFKNFTNNYIKKWETIVSYADIRFSKGKIYEKLWFSFSHNSKPNFFYFLPWKSKNIILHSRQKFQKYKLKKELEKYDENLSSIENIFNNWYRRIWDCWNKVFIYTKNKDSKIKLDI